MQLKKHLEISAQPDDETCGPTSLHSVYRHLGLPVELNEVIESIRFLEDGGTLAVMLGIDALKRGLKATVYSYNLKVFDPDWNGLSNCDLIEKLQIQLQFKPGKKFKEATLAYQEFLHLNGKIVFNDLTPELLLKYFDQNMPVLAGLSATYLYQSTREYTNVKNQVIHDDVRGFPSGHFVVLSGFEQNFVLVSDPYPGNPFGGHYYKAPISRLLNAIMLGIITYDANLLIVSN
jgi:hypothetical protein